MKSYISLLCFFFAPTHVPPNPIPGRAIKAKRPDDAAKKLQQLVSILPLILQSFDLRNSQSEHIIPDTLHGRVSEVILACETQFISNLSASQALLVTSRNTRRPGAFNEISFQCVMPYLLRNSSIKIIPRVSRPCSSRPWQRR